jgi:hypothetical protein
MDRRNIVIVRAGDKSLHPGWLNAAGEERTWDLIVSYFGSDPERYRGGDWLRIDAKGPKWPVLHDLIRDQEELVRKYDYVWLPDDDLACTCRDINRLFEVCRERKLALAQPALTADSYFTYALTLHSPGFRIRYTTFIEVMAPCFDRETMWKLLPTLTENSSGWGLDKLWPTLLGDDARMAIVDEIQTRHTRPIGGGELYRANKAQGKTAWDENEELLKKYQIPGARYWIRSAVSNSGGEIADGFRLLGLYGWGLLAAVPVLKISWRKVPRYWLSAMWQQIKGRQVNVRPGISNLST